MVVFLRRWRLSDRVPRMDCHACPGHIAFLRKQDRLTCNRHRAVWQNVSRPSVVQMLLPHSVSAAAMHSESVSAAAVHSESVSAAAVHSESVSAAAVHSRVCLSCCYALRVCLSCCYARCYSTKEALCCLLQVLRLTLARRAFDCCCRSMSACLAHCSLFCLLDW